MKLKYIYKIGNSDLLIQYIYKIDYLKIEKL